MFEFFRNAALDARNYFDQSASTIAAFRPSSATNSEAPLAAPSCFLHLYDGRDRTYFFGEYQGFRQILGTTQVFPVPTADERNGIVTVCFPNGNNPCVNDTLTVPVADAIRPVLDAYPLPNDPAGPYGARTFATSSKVTTVTDQFSIRVDHRLSNKAQLFTRFSLNQVTGPVTNPDQTAIDPSFAIQFFDHQRNAGVTYTRTISPAPQFSNVAGIHPQHAIFPGRQSHAARVSCLATDSSRPTARLPDRSSVRTRISTSSSTT